MRHASNLFQLALLLSAWALPPAIAQTVSAPCNKSIYLTFDTGHMGVAEDIARVLNQQQVKVTFFAANETTKVGDGSLGEHWASWWRERAAEGHALASHTLDHVYWQRDLPGSGASATSELQASFQMRPSAGTQAGKSTAWTAQQYCQQIRAASQRLTQITGQATLPLYRAPGGKTSKALLQTAEQCGYRHVGWASAGFLGDELPSDRYPNAQLLNQALRTIRSGDILMAHLGIWSRQDPWAPAVLEPLLVGLKARGFCFKTLRDHPDYQGWIQAQSAGVNAAGVSSVR